LQNFFTKTIDKVRVFEYIDDMQITEMRARLLQHFPDASLEITDLSGNASKVQIEIASNQFQGLSRIQQHQKVMAVFQPELQSGDLHALTLKTKTL
jgi:stress-induced morphogen